MLTFITETNLFAQRGAYLPPSMPNMGSAYLRGALLGRGRHVACVPWYEVYLRTVCVDDVERTVRAVERAGERAAGFLHEIRVKGGAAGLRQYLARAYAWATSNAVADYLVPERAWMLIRILRDLYGLQLALAEAPGDEGVPAVDVFLRRCEALGNARVAVSAPNLDEPLTRLLVRALAARGFEVVVGGPLTSTTPIEELRRVCFDDWNATWLLRGNADATLPELLDALDHGGPRAEIAGLLGRVGDGFRASAELPSPRAEDIATPDFTGCDLSRYYFPWPMLPLQLARGCYWKRCAFCRQEIFGKTHRPAEVDHVLATLRRYRAAGVRHVLLSDEALPPVLAADVAEALIESRDELGDLRMCAAARTEAGFSGEALDRLARAGLRLVFWGLESGSQASLDRMHKGTRVEENAAVLSRARSAGISNLCFVLVGFPGETEADAMQTIEFLRRHGHVVDHYRVNAFQLEPGSAVHGAPERFGVRIGAKTDGSRAVEFEVETGMSHAEAEELTARMARGEFGRLSSERYLRMPRLGFGEESILFYFLQRVVDLRLDEPPDADGARPVALTLTAAADGRAGCWLGPMDAPIHAPLEPAELALLRRMNGEVTLAELAGPDATTRACLEDLLARLRGGGRLAWIIDPRGEAP